MALENSSTRRLVNYVISNSSHDQSELPAELSNWFKTLLYIAYTLTFLIGVTGNILVCLVIKRQIKKRIIHLLTFNLAVSDLIVLFVYLPMEVYQLHTKRVWGFGTLMCQILYPVNSCTVNASIYTLVVITRDRYIAVKQPMAARQRQVSSINRWIFGIWIFSFALTIPLMFVVGVSNRSCTENWPNIKLERAYWFSIFAIQFVVPLIFIVLTYLLIIFHLRSQNATYAYQNLLGSESENGKFKERLFNDITPVYTKAEMKVRLRQMNSAGNNCMELRRKRQLNKMLKMIFIWVIVYCICVLPQHTVYFANSFSGFDGHKYVNYIFVTANYFLIVNSSINPVIYGALNDEIKKGAKKLLLCRNACKNVRSLLVPLDKRFWLSCVRSNTKTSSTKQAHR